VSVAQQREGGIQPTLSFYPATAITNWRTVKRGSRVMLTLVVLRETHEAEDGFELKQEMQYRVLRMTEAGYQVEIWRKNKKENGGEEWRQAEDPVIPKQGNGRPWLEIPFQFTGSQNNDPAIDPAPLL